MDNRSRGPCPPSVGRGVQQASGLRRGKAMPSFRGEEAQLSPEAPTNTRIQAKFFVCCPA